VNYRLIKNQLASGLLTDLLFRNFNASAYEIALLGLTPAPFL